MKFTAQQTSSNAMNQNKIHLLIFIQQMQCEVHWKRHTSQAKGSSLLSKTSNIKEKEKNCSLHVKPFTNISTFSTSAAYNLARHY
jgi:hypothetical protein